MRVTRQTASRHSGCGLAFGLVFCSAFLFFGVMAIRQGLLERGPGVDLGQWLVPLGVGLLFAGIGVGGIALVLRGHRAAKAEEARRAEEPNRPWLWKEEWARGRIAHDARAGAIVLWVMAVAFLGISAPAVLAIPEEWESGNRLILLALLFPAAGAFLAALAVRATLQWRRFGHSELELQQVPAVPGHRFLGLVHVSDELASAESFRVRMTCVRRRRTGSGKNSRTHDTTLWTDEAHFARSLRTRSGGGVAVPVSFVLPEGARESDDSNPRDKTLWIVDVEAQLPGVDFHAEFEVPVFRADAADLPPEAAGSDPYEDLRVPPPDTPPGAAEGIVVTRPPSGGLDLWFPPRRHLKAAFGTGLATVVLAGVALLIARSDAPLLVRIAAPAFIGLFLLVIGWSAAWLWTGSIRTRATRDGVEVRTRCLGISRTVSLPASAIEDVKLDVDMQTGGRRGTTYHDIEVLHADGKRLTIGSQVKSPEEAKRIVAALREVWPSRGSST